MERVPGPDELTVEDAERLLELYGGRRGQERMVLAADRLGISAARIQKIAGIARDTVARILDRHATGSITIAWRPTTAPDDTVGEHSDLWGGLERRARELVLGQPWVEHSLTLAEHGAVIRMWPEKHAPDGAWERAVDAARKWAAAETESGHVCTVTGGKS